MGCNRKRRFRNLDYQVVKVMMYIGTLGCVYSGERGRALLARPLGCDCEFPLAAPTKI